MQRPGVCIGLYGMSASLLILFKGVWRIARPRVASEDPLYGVVAVDLVNLEKPYTQALEGVSMVHKNTLPGKHGQVRLTRGYPTITASMTAEMWAIIRDDTSCVN